MESIIPIKGNVRHVITLDPGVWIFDDRRIDLDTYFTADKEEYDEIETYKKEMGAHWSREIMEGATFPPTLKTEKKYERTKVLTGTFAIAIEHFFKNAEPAENATTVYFETAEGTEHAFPLHEAMTFLFQFSEKGKPLLEDGPAYLLFPDGSNKETPIRNIRTIRVE